ncbi:MAG TPA: flagellar export protein FliJ [Planctomycetota bacterium]|nr:flagellar export protein FliJ [Planctomycetota bacterium]
MKKFRFRLERVLNYREQVEKQKQIALTEVHRLVVDHQQKLLDAYAVLEHARDDLRRAEGVGEIDVQTVRDSRVYIGTLKRRIAEVLKRLRKLEIELEQKRDEAVQARKERKVLELVKTRRAAEHRKETGRVEQAELDDIATKNEVLKRTAS